MPSVQIEYHPDCKGRCGSCGEYQMNLYHKKIDGIWQFKPICEACLKANVDEIVIDLL